MYMQPSVLLSFFVLYVFWCLWAHEPMSPEVSLSWLTLKSLSISLVIPATKLFFLTAKPSCAETLYFVSYAYHLIHCHHLIHLSSQSAPAPPTPLSILSITLPQMAATVATTTTQRQQACILLSFLLLFLGSEGSKMERSLIGSRPPRCERRCMNCGHCEAVQVPSVPQEIKSWSDDSNYKPLSWKCKCGDKIINP